MKKRNIHIIKASGQKVPFSYEKLHGSLQRAGAGEATIQKVMEELDTALKEGMHTKKIYALAFRLLRKKHPPAADRYTLKKAIMELGPSGFPFEQYISEIFKFQGFTVKTDQILTGHCVQHEVDILAEKGNEVAIIECKYHNLQGVNCDVKIPLYINARFLDLEMNGNQHGQRSWQGWVVTNTRFTSDATQYGLCAGLRLISWDFPDKGSLRELIDQSGLYPVTCLDTLSKKEKQVLLEKGVMLCKNLPGAGKILSGMDIKEERIRLILASAAALCSKSNRS
jgi:hypothetical protein